MTDDLDPLDDYLTNFAARVMQDAMSEATSAYWLRRAAQFEAARPRPGEFHGRATPEKLRAQDARLARTAEMCRRRADLTRDPMQEVA